MRLRWLGAALLLTPGCIPARDNPNDPSVRPDANIAVSVEGDPTRAAGGRYAEWIFDGSGSGDARRFAWSISSGDADVPEDVAAWTSLGDGTTAQGFDVIASREVVDALGVVTQASNGTLTNALLRVGDFAKFAPEDPDGTGAIGRWIRLTVTDGGGDSAATHARITVVNRAPFVTLGPDRRIAPGGRDGFYAPHVVVVQALAHDPDEGDDDLLLTVANPGQWYVEGALAAAIPHDGNGLITDPVFVVGPGRLRFEAPVFPGRSRLRFEIDDQTPFAGGATGTATLAADIVSSHWAYGAGDGQFTRLDTSRLVGPLETDATAVRELLGLNDYFLLTSTTEGGGRVEMRGTGLQMLVDTAGNGISAAPVAQDSLDFFVLANTGAIRRYTFDGQALTSITLPAIFSNGGYATGFSVTFPRIVPGGDDALWVSRLDGAAWSRLPIAGAETPMTSFLDGTTKARASAPDGATGLWVAGQADPGGEDYVGHLHADGTRQQNMISDCGLDGGGIIIGLAYDPVRSSLWISATGLPTDLLCVRDGTGAWHEQAVASAAALTLNPVDGSVYMPFVSGLVGGDGLGFSRYAAGTAESIEFVPIPTPFHWWYGTRLFATKTGNLAAQIRTNSGDDRWFWSEAGEIPGPEIIIPGIEPYQFAEVDYAIDPHTGFLWVWRPDLLAIEAWSPDGQLLRTVDLGLSAFQGTALRGAIGLDPDLRTIFFAWAPRYTTGIPDDVGRLLVLPIPDIAIGPSDEELLGTTDDLLAPMSYLPDPILTFSLVSDLAVLPAFPSSILCLGATVADEQYTSGFCSRYDTSDGSRVAFATNPSTPSVAVQAAAAPYTGDCWFVLDEPEATGGPIGVIDFLGNATAITGYAAHLSQPDAAGGLVAGRRAGAATQFVGTVTGAGDVAAPVVTLESVFDTLNPTGVSIDDYYGHIFVAFEDGSVVRLQSRGADQVEMAYFGGFSYARLQSP